MIYLRNLFEYFDVLINLKWCTFIYTFCMIYDKCHIIYLRILHRDLIRFYNIFEHLSAYL